MVTGNDWHRYIEKVVTEMELVGNEGDARKVHNLAAKVATGRTESGQEH